MALSLGYADAEGSLAWVNFLIFQCLVLWLLLVWYGSLFLLNMFITIFASRFFSLSVSTIYFILISYPVRANACAKDI